MSTGKSINESWTSNKWEQIGIHGDNTDREKWNRETNYGETTGKRSLETPRLRWDDLVRRDVEVLVGRPRHRKGKTEDKDVCWDGFSGRLTEEEENYEIKYNSISDILSI